MATARRATVTRMLGGSDGFAYEVAFRPRKTFGISVRLDGRVLVAAPKGSSLAQVDEIVRTRSAWIRKHLKRIGDLPKQSQPVYAHGELHDYLGVPYALDVTERRPERVQLVEGRIEIHTGAPAEPGRIQALLAHWYRHEAQRVFSSRVALWLPLLPNPTIPFKTIRIRSMTSRWGSCTTAGAITLNLRLIQAPLDLVDYVIVHELCHLCQHNHGPGFYRLLDSLMPDWRERRRRLNQLAVW